MSNISPTYTTALKPLKSHSHSTYCISGTVQPLRCGNCVPSWSFYMFSVSHLPENSREEDKGGPVALDNVSRELPMLEARKPRDTLKHKAYLGPWCHSRVNLATSLLSRDCADCWQVAKVGTAAEKWHLQTWGQVQRELKYHHEFSCLCVPQERAREGTVSQAGKYFSLTLHFWKWNLGRCFESKPAFCLCFLSPINLNYWMAWWF